ncbi:MAG TPA: caspase family protein, partial [Allocoleopsis sp.]
MRTIEKNMGTQNCIAIGINRYNFFQPLSFAEADAIGIGTLLCKEVNWERDRCLILTDTSPPWVVTHTNENFMTNQEEIRSTYPTKNNIIDIMQDFALKTLKPGDLFWLFFSGYGVTFNGEDYLMPIDGNPEKILETGISVSWLFDQLIKTGSSVILFLDINRSQGLTGEHPVGFYTTKLAQQCGIPTILSCQLDQFSHEAPGLGQGLFTAVLLEGLRYDPQTTLNTLDWYLRTRLPELSEHHWLPVQIPLSVIPSSQIGDRAVLSPVNNPQNQMNTNSVADIIPPVENPPRLPSAAIIPVSQIATFSPRENNQNNLYQLPPLFSEKEAEIPPAENNYTT